MAVKSFVAMPLIVTCPDSPLMLNMVLLVVIDLVFVGVIIVFVGVGVEQVGAIDAIAVGCSHETAISEVVILIMQHRFRKILLIL